MVQHWRWLTFLHWRYPAEVVQAVLPEPLVVETFDGTGWVGLVPLLMDRVRAPRLPACYVKLHLRLTAGWWARAGMQPVGVGATRTAAAGAAPVTCSLA